MSSLAEFFPIVNGFFSYAREDDRDSKGRISEFMDAIRRELGGRLGRSEHEFLLFQDQTTIRSGKKWDDQINKAIKQTVFFITVVTPRSVASPNCSFELRSFLDRQNELGRDDLVFPILFIPVPKLKERTKWRDDPVLSIIGEHQFPDWTNLRYQPVDAPAPSEAVGRFCHDIVEALYIPWTPPTDRRPGEDTGLLGRFEDRQAPGKQRFEEEAPLRRAEAEIESLNARHKLNITEEHPWNTASPRPRPDLISLLQQSLTPQIVISLARAVGINEAVAQRLVAAAVPAILAALATTAAAPGGAQKVSDAVSMSDPDIVAKAVQAASGGNVRFLNQGATLLSALFGASGFLSLVGALSQYSGAPHPATQTLLGAVTHATIGKIGEQDPSNWSDPSALLSMLSRQESAVSAALPLQVSKALGPSGLLASLGAAGR
jgi:hypothetical protein